MNPADVPPNAYTDSPELHSNPILGGVQALFWLFFHPSAWRNYLARIDPQLSPNFSPLELGWAKLRNPALARLLLPLGLLSPLLAGLIAGALLGISGVPGGAIVAGVLASMSLAFYGFIASTLGIGVPAGLAIGLTGVIPILTCIWVAWPTFDVVAIMPVAIASGATYSMAGSVVSSLVDKDPSRPLGQQLGGSIVGLLIGCVGVGIVIIAAFVLVNATAVGIVDGVLSGLALGLAIKLVRDWRRAIVGGITLGLIAGLFGWTMFGIAEGTVAFASAETLTIAVAIVLIIAIGAVAGGTRKNWRLNLGAGIVIGGIAIGAIGSMVFGFLSMLPTELAQTLQFAGFFGTMLFALFYVLTERIAGVWAGILAGALPCAGGWIAALIIVHDEPLWPALPLGMCGILLGLTLVWWRPLLYPFLAAWNTLLYRADERRPADRPSLLRWNSAFWDEHRRLRLPGLDEHLVLVAERNPAEGQAAIQYLTTTRQRWAAQAAQIELEARRLERCANVETIGDEHGRLSKEGLPGPASVLLGRFGHISQDLYSALNQTMAYHRRLLLRNVLDDLSSLLNELTRSSEAYAVRFYPVATRWYQVVSNYLDELAEEVELRQEIDNPYIFGVPLTDQHPIFVGRADIAARIEQLLLDRRRPPLLLYGQRRMGKTSLLRNLGRLLPSSIVPLFVDGEGIAGAVDCADLLYCIAREMVRSAEQQGTALPRLQRDSLVQSPFTMFGEWLDQVERTLETQGQKVALLALDEFEALDSVFGKGRFDEFDFLRMLRHLIQHRPRFKVMLSGSHLLDEYQRWASYLVNVQVVKIGYLKEREARQLIERPVKDFTLRYEPEASQRVWELARGHPHLLQLLCYEIVELKNSQAPSARQLVRLDDVETAVPKALNTGKFFFVDLQHNQVEESGASLLRFLAKHGEGAVVDREIVARHFPEGFDQALELLLRRDLVEATDGGYRFQVELIRRWFA